MFNIKFYACWAINYWNYYNNKDKMHKRKQKRINTFDSFLHTKCQKKKT